MEQFSLKKWLQDKSRRIVTRSGVEAEIIHDKYPLVAIINGVAYNFDNDGKLQLNKTNHKYDLFFVDEEKKLSDFEKAMIQFSHERNSLIQFEHTMEEINAHLYLYYEKLLDLARKEIRKEEPISKDLEEEIKNYFSNWLIDLNSHKEFILQFARHFAEWQKQQMMKNAVYGYVSLCHDYPRRRSLVAVADGLVNFEYAEKVKIIIYKTE